MKIVIYARVDETTPERVEKRRVWIAGTGHHLPPSMDFQVFDYSFLNTVKLHDGALMFHVFAQRH